MIHAKEHIYIGSPPEGSGLGNLTKASTAVHCGYIFFKTQLQSKIEMKWEKSNNVGFEVQMLYFAVGCFNIKYACLFA